MRQCESVAQHCAWWGSRGPNKLYPTSPPEFWANEAHGQTATSLLGKGWIRASDRLWCLLTRSAGCWGSSGAAPLNLWLRGAEQSVHPCGAGCVLPACYLPRLFILLTPSIFGEEKGSGRWAEYLRAHACLWHQRHRDECSFRCLIQIGIQWLSVLVKEPG